MICDVCRGPTIGVNERCDRCRQLQVTLMEVLGRGGDAALGFVQRAIAETEPARAARRAKQAARDPLAERQRMRGFKGR